MTVLEKIYLNDNCIEGFFGEEAAGWFIVDKWHKKAFIKRLAEKMITDGCKNFDFTGRFAQRWENIFDDMDIELKPQITEDNVALTMAWRNRRDFAEAMTCSVKEKNYIFYDSEKACEEILKLLE